MNPSYFIARRRGESVLTIKRTSMLVRALMMAAVLSHQELWRAGEMV